MTAKTKNRILEIYQDVREEPGTPYDDRHFLQGLVSGPKKVDDTFHGKLRKIRFFDRVEREFAICLPHAEEEKAWTLDRLCKYIEERAADPDINLNLAHRRINENQRADFTLMVVMNVILLLVSLQCTALGIGLLVVFNALFFRFRHRRISHYKDLADKITAVRDGA